MAIIAAALYDPVTHQTNYALNTTLKAMTAFDTSNLHLTFTAPANGAVLVRLRGVTRGSTLPMNLMGVIDSGNTKVYRVAPWYANKTASATMRHQNLAEFVVPGLTPGNSYTWDAAYAVQVTAGSTPWSVGGPDDAAGNDASGGFSFEIWETTNLLGACLHDPGTASSFTVGTLRSVASGALDTTNLRIPFTVPASGRVLVNMRGGAATGVASNTPAVLMYGVLEGSTVKGRVIPASQQPSSTTSATSDQHQYEASFVVPNLSPGANLTWDAAIGVQVVLASQNFKWGGPDDANGDDAWGAFAYDIWAA